MFFGYLPGCLNPGWYELLVRLLFVPCSFECLCVFLPATAHSAKCVSAIVIMSVQSVCHDPVPIQAQIPLEGIIISLLLARLA